MNDLQHPCEQWAESLSLAAAGCLSQIEERNVLRHLKSCDACRERFHELADVCEFLTNTQLPHKTPELAIVKGALSKIASDEANEPQVRETLEMIQPHQSFSLTKWRWIMRSRIFRVSAAALVVVMVVGVFSMFYGGGATPAFADFVAPILEARTAKFKIQTEVKGPPSVTTTGEVLVWDASRTRQKLVTTMIDPANPDNPGKTEMVMVMDLSQGTSLSLDPVNKTAIVVSLTNMPKEQASRNDMFTLFRSILLDVQGQPHVERKRLGEKEIDGRQAVGFRISNKGMVIDLWGDPKTGLPLVAETTMSVFSNARTTMSDFEFDVDLDESLFSVTPPKGYSIQKINADASPPKEEDLITTFREYHRLSDGAFPDTLDLQKMMKLFGEKYAAEMATQNSNTKKDEATQELMQKTSNLQLRLQRGVIFAIGALPSDADAHYAGQGVSFGDANRPVFWYRPINSKGYRVIFADLSIVDAENSPSIPNAQRVSPTSRLAN